MYQFLKFIFGTKLYKFRTVPLSIIRSFSLYTQQLYMSYKFADSLRAGSGQKCSSVMILVIVVVIVVVVAAVVLRLKIHQLQ